MDGKTYDLDREKNTFTLSPISTGKHAWAIQGVYADSSVTDWLSCGSFTMPAKASNP